MAVFDVLLRVLWSGKILLATPHRLLAAVYEHGPRFSGFEQQDAQDFYYFLLERTHDELVRADSLLNAAAISSFCLTVTRFWLGSGCWLCLIVPPSAAGGEDGRGLAGAARPRESLQG